MRSSRELAPDRYHGNNSIILSLASTGRPTMRRTGQAGRNRQIRMDILLKLIEIARFVNAKVKLNNTLLQPDDRITQYVD